MNRAEAINYLTSTGLTEEQVMEVVEALKQQTCEDAVSRQAVHEAIEKWAGSMNVLVVLPTREVRPLLDSIHALPSVNPQPKTGHWIPSHIPESILDECSECGFSCGAFTFNYCPNCGCRMVEPQESEEV